MSKSNISQFQAISVKKIALIKQFRRERCIHIEAMKGYYPDTAVPVVIWNRLYKNVLFA